MSKYQINLEPFHSIYICFLDIKFCSIIIKVFKICFILIFIILILIFLLCEHIHFLFLSKMMFILFSIELQLLMLLLLFLRITVILFRLKLAIKLNLAISSHMKIEGVILTLVLRRIFLAVLLMVMMVGMMMGIDLGWKWKEMVSGDDRLGEVESGLYLVFNFVLDVALERHEWVNLWQFLIARHTYANVAVLILVKLSTNQINAVAAQVAEISIRTLLSLQKVSAVRTDLFRAWQFSALMAIGHFLSPFGALLTVRSANFILSAG